MLAGDVYYCWSCDAHCRALPIAIQTKSNQAAVCPRCQEHLDEDCRLEQRPTVISYSVATDRERDRKAAVSSPGLWPTRAAAMH